MHTKQHEEGHGVHGLYPDCNTWRGAPIDVTPLYFPHDTEHRRMPYLYHVAYGPFIIAAKVQYQDSGAPLVLFPRSPHNDSAGLNFIDPDVYHSIKRAVLDAWLDAQGVKYGSIAVRVALDYVKAVEGGANHTEGAV